MRRRLLLDLYHQFMTVGWPTIFASFFAFFLVFNLLFAAVYSLQDNDIANLNPAGYWGRFFFSVETLATVGYGDMHPQTPFAHIVAALEIFVGLMSLALITGMMFARFSKPTARFVFAHNAVVRPMNGKMTLMLRAANARQNIVMEAAAQLRLKYLPIFAQAVGGRKAATFAQIDRRISMMIDLQLASQLPLVQNQGP